MAATIPGSSPLARGLRLGGPAPSHGRRIIPARAGFTVPRAHMWTARRDHPRSRGVYRDTPVSRQICRGSSPLARGLLHNVPTFNRPTRIIPARAGFTRGAASIPWDSEDHPRSRGVYGAWKVEHDGRPGSSPLARGLQGLDRRDSDGGRIIPARAGFTLFSVSMTRSGEDHPRSRGVYPHGDAHRQHPEGSSPLARGLHHAPARRPRLTRIIPARAGFTMTGSGMMSAWGDHPRSRGVYLATAWGRQVRRGSSPLARGLPPARRRGIRLFPDHPRSRGVYVTTGGSPVDLCGSSPLARGLLSGLRRGSDE